MQPVEGIEAGKAIGERKENGMDMQTKERIHSPCH